MRCAVVDCKNTTNNLKETGLNFHVFPVRDPSTCKIWVQKCKRGDEFDFKNARVCSEHFTKDDYHRDLRNELLGLPIKKKLKQGSIPTIFIARGSNPAMMERRKQNREKFERKKIVVELLAAAEKPKPAGENAPKVSAKLPPKISNTIHKTINNKQRTVNNPSPKIVRLCANCCSSLPPSSTTKARDIPTSSSKNQTTTTNKNSPKNSLVHEAENRSTTNDNISSTDVNKMLTIIYNLDFIPRLQQKHCTVGGKLKETEQVDFSLCGSCTSLLQCLFSLYSQFNQIRKIESLLSQQIKELNSLIDCGQSKKQPSSSSSSNKFEASSNDRGPWVKVGARLEDPTVEPPQNNLITSVVFSSRPLSFPSNDQDDDDNDNDHDMDYQPSPSPSENSWYEEEDVKPFEDPLATEPELDSNETNQKNLPDSFENQTISADEEHGGQEDADFNNDDDSMLVEPDSNQDDFPDFANLPEIVVEPPVLTYEQVVGKMEKVLSSRAGGWRSRYLYRKRQETVPCPCRYCQEDFQTPEDRAAHVREKHLEGHKYFCETCGIRFVALKLFKYHQTQNCSAFLVKPAPKKKITKTPVERNFPCTAVINNAGELCPYRAQNAVLLQRHMLNIHPEEKDKVKCCQCSKVFKNKEYLKQHFNRIHTERGKQLYHSSREKKYARIKARTKAVNDEGFVCRHCGIDFITKHRHTVHLRQVHGDFGPKSKIAVCEFCGNTYKDRCLLNKHMRAVHVDERLFVCEECGRSYKTQSSLGTHRSKSHNEEGRQRSRAYKKADYQRLKLIREQKARREEAAAVGAKTSSSDNESEEEQEETPVVASSSTSLS